MSGKLEPYIPEILPTRVIGPGDAVPPSYEVPSEIREELRDLIDNHVRDMAKAAMQDPTYERKPYRPAYGYATQDSTTDADQRMRVRITFGLRTARPGDIHTTGGM